MTKLKTLIGVSAVAIFLTAIAAVGPAHAVVKPAGNVLSDFDAAGGIKIAVGEPAFLAASQRAGMTTLRQAAGADVRATFNQLSGAPRSLTSARPLSAPSAAKPERIAMDFLRANRDLWRFSDDDLAGLTLDAQYTDAHNGVSHVFFVQTSGGIPVFPASLGIHLNGKGQVISVQGDVFPGIRAPGAAQLTPEAAAEAAAQHVGVEYQAVRVAAAGDAVQLAPGAFRSPIKVTQTVYALFPAPRPAYRMTLEKNGQEWYDLVVDAGTGQVLHRRNLYQFDGQLAPSAPTEANPATPRALVYTEHALSTVRGTGDLFRKYPFTADPLGRPRGFANAPLSGADANPVLPHGGDPVNATIAQTVLPLPNSSTPMRSNALPLATSPQSPDGWFILQSGRYQTIGNNIDAKDDHAADNEASIGLRSDGGFDGDFTGPAFVFQNFHGQNGPYADTAAQLAGAAPDLPAVVLNLFYVTNWYHDFLYHLGFTEAAGNFQQDNFGLGGAGNDFVFTDAQDGSGTDNANFGTPPDGSNPRMQMFLWTAPERDGDFDFDIIIHEYSHGLSNRLVGGPNNTSCLGAGVTGEAGGMGEGWGDWFAATIADEPAVAEYSYADGANGLRSYPQDAGPDDYTYGFLCTGPPSQPNPLGCEVHGAGEFWAIVLWEMREAMINRFHNRDFPGNQFPTFLAAGAGGNVRNAQGRTFDGSNTAAQIDYVAIENAAFAAMFMVVDAMKLSPCNPTMVDQRDAILAADRTMGGEFQDLIWRVFANRGIGELAASAGGDTPATVEDFIVPATVEACEAAGGPLPAPSVSGGSTAPNTATLTITNNGAAEYIISRGAQGPGTPVEPTAFIEVGRTSGTSFTDIGLEGGFTYYYRVRAARNDDCISASNVVAVVPLGGTLPCTTDPTFLGLVRVIDPGDCERLLLDWAPAASNCVGGPAITYNVYRSSQANFVPGASNRIAAGVQGNTFVDIPGALDTLFYYIVRAEDSTTGHGGPANGGNEDNNTVRVAGLVTSATLLNQGFSDDVETGPDNSSSAHFTSSGLTIPVIPERGGWFRDDSPAPVTPHSPTTVWHTFNPDNQVFSPTASRLYELNSDILTITPSSILTFFHTFQAEGGFDGGVVEVALVDGTTGTVGTFQDLDSRIYENGYTGLLDATSQGANSNPLFGRRAFTGGVLGPMKRVRALLGGLVPSGEPTQEIVVRFLFGNDVANSADPSPTGAYLPGWYIDDISVDQPCCPISPAPQNLAAVASAPNEISLTWDPPAGTTVLQYAIFREQVTDVAPVIFANQIGTVPGAQTSFLDTQLVGGATYAYVVRATPDTGCPSGDSNVVVTTATGTCNVLPTFAGLDAVMPSPDATCALDLSWDAGFANCPGASVTYNVYRSTNSSFIPASGDLIAVGLSGLSFHDDAALLHGTTYYYVVRAEDSASDGGGPANGGNEDNNLVRVSGSPQGPLAPGPNFSDDVEPASEPGYSTFSTRTVGGWQVLADATAHSPSQAWVALDDQPGVPELTAKDDRLTLPPVSLTSASTMSFWHNFDFAQFPLSTPPTAYQSGGVLEISADGDTWIDLGPYITAGGYNGVVDTDSQAPLKGRPAWIGSSDAAPGNRTGAMTQVTVDLGAAIGDPDTFNVSTLHAARVRFRLGGTFQVLIGGIQGSGWGVDDLSVSNVLAAGACATATCGDAVVNSGEECDDGAFNSDTAPDACRTTCVLASCGDGVADTGEECDDGSENSDTEADACRTTCALAACGDSVTDTDEECDDGSANSDTQPDACRTTCALPACGDSVVDTGEFCDDGGTINGDGCSEVCEIEPAGLALDPSGVDKNRFISFVMMPAATAQAGPLTALRVTLVSLHHPDPPNLPMFPAPDFSAYESGTCTTEGEANGCARWVGKPSVFLESQDSPGLGSFVGARLQCTPAYYDFAANGLIHVTGAEIIPSSTYEVVHLGPSCMGNEEACTAVSGPLAIFTGRSADITAPFSPPSNTAQPDALDITQLVNKFKSLTGAPVKSICQLQPNLPELNADVNALDIVAGVDAFKQRAYAFSGPCACPSVVTCGSTPCTSPTPCVTAFGMGATCVKTCTGGDNDGDPCINDTHCPDGTCGNGFCRDRCGRCGP